MSENLSNMSYTNKSFQDIYPELLDLTKKISYRWNPTESNESDPGVVLLKLCAIIADKLNYNIDKNVLECFPISVTQDNNARELFKQLGYIMHWYIAASSEIKISWKTSDTGNVYYLPRFSMVSNDDNSIIYTITSDVNIPTDGSIVTCSVLQGMIQDFMINGDTLITTANLDSNNRIYFSNVNVAENGIFIKNNLFDYSDWHKVDNLEVEEFGQPVYSFGISQDGNSCYLEFPEDAFDIFGDGLTIKYIVTDGEDGNISSRIIEKFYNDPTVYDTTDEEQSVMLTTSTVNVVNLDPIRNGSNPESISEAYSNYKKTVGTFDTLVTLRDYNNAIRSAKLNNINIVSNGFVTDRTNDIQSSYKIVSDVEDVDRVYTIIEENNEYDKSSEFNKNYYKAMNAFDLKLYLLDNILSSGNIIPNGSSYKSAEIYNKTFEMVDNTDYSESYKVDLIKQSLEESKSLQHDFQHILSDKLCMLKNKYPIKCKIIPQYALTAVQVEDVKNNVIKALYNNLNSRKVEFGDEVSYNIIYDIITKSDERIKSIMLDDLEYTTFAVYYDSATNEYKEIEINTFSDFINGYYNTANDKFYYNYNSATGEFSNIIAIDSKSVYVDIPTGKCYKYADGVTSEDIKSDIQLSIYAKSVLAGKTQLLVPDDVFDYRLNHKFVDQVNDIRNISTNANIRVYTVDDGDSQASTVLKDNESINFYAPNIVDKVSYSSYTKCQFALFNEIDVNTDYKLSEGESITFYWKNSDDENAPYLYYKYGAGTIIQSNFTLREDVGYCTNGLVSKNHDLDSVEYIGFSLEFGSGQCNYSQSNYLASIYSNDYILSSTKTVKIRDKVEVTITNPTYCYWILNDRMLDSSGQYVYKLFDSATLTDEQMANNEEIVQKYILQPGEYFIHTDKDSIEILYAGTKITRTSKSKRVEAMVCVEANIDSISEVGVSDIDSVLKQINSGEYLTLTEMQIKTVPSNATLYLGAYDWQRDASLEITPNTQLRGTKLLGEGKSPKDYSLKASSGKTAYNPEFENGCRWHSDTNDDDEEVYIENPDGYSDNIDITKLLNIDPTGKDPNMVGLKPQYGYSNVQALEAPYFESGVFYEIIDSNNKDIYDDSNYRELETEPANWKTNFSDYYWKRPIHAYNPKYSSSVLWEDDNKLKSDKGTQWITCWQEDDEYLALGYQVNEQDVFPDLEKLDGMPDDLDSSNYVGAPTVYWWSYYYNFNGKTNDDIIAIKSKLYNIKYFRVGPDNGPYDWYKNNQYKDYHDARLPKNTYHAYNPKFKENGYAWESFTLDNSNNDISGFIRITGENNKPSKCLLMSYQPSTSSAYTLDSNGNINNYWAIEYNYYDFILLDSTPSDAVIFDSPNNSYFTERVNTIVLIGSSLTDEMKSEFYIYRMSIPSLKYIALKTSLSSHDYNSWYECVPSDVGVWKRFDDWADHNTQDSIKNGLNFIQLSDGDDPTINNYVSIIPKNGQYAANVKPSDSNIEIYETEFFRVIKKYIPKSWTQNIEFIDSSNVKKIKNVDYYTDPNLEGISPSLDSHVIHQYDGYAWLEDYNYAFDDAQTSSSIGSASSINVVGASPTDEDYKIPAIKDGKAYNPTFSYEYVWRDDGDYIEWDNPIVILSGDKTTPYSAKLSVYQLDQHVINPDYVSGYTWVKISSQPSGQNDANRYDFTGNQDAYPDIPPSLVEPYRGHIKRYAHNTEADVWWQVSVISGKSWTSVRIPVGKSWTAYPVVISDSWTSVQEYIGKSWYTSIDAIKRAWRSISTPIDVSFTNNGAVIVYPEGYTLNDFYISSKLEDSSEIEEWPKVLVDDGWEAYSYLNLKVSKNIPFSMYENQEIIWYNKNYTDSNPNGNTGVISGRYTWNYNANAIIREISSYNDYFEVDVEIDSEHSTLVQPFCSSISPSEGLHLFDRIEEKSWSSTVEFVLSSVDYAGHENEYDLNNCILVNDFSDVSPKQSGIYYYTVDNGVVTMKVSVESGNYYFIEDSEYSSRGFEIYDTTVTTSDDIITNISAGFYAAQSLKLIALHGYYVSVYVPIILMSDFGYDLHGGNMVDVSRLDALGNFYYMNLYCYENVYYPCGVRSAEHYLNQNVDDKIEIVDNYVYINLNNFEFIGVDYLEADLLFNFPDGKYILDVMNSIPNLKDLTILVIPVKDMRTVTINNSGEIFDYSVILNQMCNKELTNLYKSRKYYLDLNIEDLKKNDPHFKDCDSFLLRVAMTFNFDPSSAEYLNSYYETSGTIRFGFAYKYEKPDSISDGMYEAVLNKMFLYDDDSLFNFTNVISDDLNISNPLDSNSFLNKDHIYNEFTICQIDTNNSNILTTNNK